jgi:glycosyltransferase involved in cell wall biosynthesis
MGSTDRLAVVSRVEPKPAGHSDGETPPELHTDAPSAPSTTSVPRAEGPVDLSVIVNIFREGRLIHPTLRSLDAAIEDTVANGWTVEVILVLDNTDAVTLRYLDAHLGGLFRDAAVHRLYVRNGDLGLSRNSGFAYARGRFIAFSDDDNLYSRNWLVRSLARLDASSADEILHPAVVIHFGSKNVLWRTMDSDDPNIDLRAIVEFNFWDATCVAPRRVFEQIPYAPSLAGPGFGPEDWHWNCQALDAGWKHRLVPETVMFYRVKSSGSLLALLTENSALLAPTRYLSTNRWNDQNKFPSLVEPDVRRLDERPDDPAVAVEGATGWTSKRSDRMRRRVLQMLRQSAQHAARRMRWMARVHPRIATFAAQIRPAVNDLLSPPRRTALIVTPAPEPTLVNPFPLPSVEEFPDWLMEAWRLSHLLEPALFPARSTVESIIRWAPSPGIFTDVYWQLLAKLTSGGKGPDYLFLIPWLATGGASAVMNNYLRAIRRARPEARIVVLSTMQARTESDVPLDGSIEYVDVPTAFHDLSADMQDRLVGTVLVQLAPANVHVINSPVGFRVLASYSRQLTVQSKLFVSVFTIDVTPEGQRAHYVLDAIRSYIDHVAGIFADNERLVEFLVDTYALPRSKFFVHYQPLSEKVLESAERGRRGAEVRNLRSDRLAVLWAARFDRQKRPDLLVAISERSRGMGLPIDFYASGTGVLEDASKLIERLEESAVTYLGPFEESVGSLPREFDVLLMTSEWEGLPLTLLDGAIHELTILSAAVGGVTDFVEDGSTGYLVARFDDVDAYVAKLASLASDRVLLEAPRASAADLVRQRHGWNEFAFRVTVSAGYLGQ